MSSIIGCSLLLLSVLFKLASTIKERWQRGLNIVGSVAVILSFCWLLYALFSLDYSLITVYKSTSNQLPILYRLSAMWASHEGSMLLWLCLLAIVSIWLTTQEPVMKNGLLVFSFVEMLYICYVLFSSNPFLPSGGKFSQGVGLNPILQDVALSIHPPILYAGYIACLVPFAIAIEILANNDAPKKLLQLMFTVSSLALALMSAGIFLGSWWAYRELDWGGYWFFDPVENISLLPWLVTIALHHCLMLQLKKPRIELLRYCLFLALLAFGIVAFGFFFVRSGVISSIHSFAFSSSRGAYLLAISLIINIFAIGFYLLRSKNPKQTSQNIPGGRMIMLASYNWLVMCLILLIAIIYPIYGMFVLDIDMAIAPDYYHKVFLPFGAVSIILTSLAISASRVLAIAALALSAIVIGILALPIYAALFIAPSIWLLMASFKKYIHQRRMAGYEGQLKPAAILLSHGSFAVLVIAITLNTYLSSMLQFKGVVGHAARSEQIEAKLLAIKHATGPNYLRQIYMLEVEAPDGTKVTLRPENRLYRAENSLAQEADIFSFLLYDLYAIGRKNDNNVVQAEIYIKPLMSLIWAASIGLVTGLLLGFFETRRKINQNC